VFVGNFWLAGPNEDGIQHTLQDTILTKDFWRKTLSNVNARIARQLGQFSDNKLTLTEDITNTDIVLKLNNSYLGIGDIFMNYGKDFTTQADIKTRMDKDDYDYEGKQAIVMELVRPHPDLAVHSLDIVTCRTPDGDVKVVTCLLWADCTTDSSMSTRAGYSIDVDTETVISPCKWYSAAFLTMEAPLVGRKVPGIKKACASAIAAHKSIPMKWVTVIGWDCMVMPDEDVVFFEGNFAGYRMPRRFFISFSNFLEFMTNYFWPFDSNHSVQPA
jgi:hypothetical protein